jgi:hypothetical protein
MFVNWKIADYPRRLPERFGFLRCIGFVAAHRRAWRGILAVDSLSPLRIGPDPISNGRFE